MGFFKQAKDMYQLRGKAKKMDAELRQIHVEAEEGGVKITVNAKQELVDIHIPDELATDLREVERRLKEAHKRANQKAQEVGAQKMQEMMGGLQGLQSMLGGGDDK